MEAPRSRALASVNETLLPLVIETVPKLFAALISVMSFAPAVKLVVPAAVTVAVCVIGPLAVIERAPLDVIPALALTVPIVTAFASCHAIFPPVKLTVLKLFRRVRQGNVTAGVPAVPPRSVTLKVWPAFKLTEALWVRL